MSRFKKGDLIRCKLTPGNAYKYLEGGKNPGGGGFVAGAEFIITDVTGFGDDEDRLIYWGNKDGNTNGVYGDSVEPINNYSNNKSKNMSLVQSFTNLFTKEPQKSFKKAGFIGDDGMLTSDGGKVFVSWLLEKNADAFKAEVVDPILKEQENCK